jgi:hypothetical protein
VAVAPVLDLFGVIDPVTLLGGLPFGVLEISAVALLGRLYWAGPNASAEQHGAR